MSRNEVKKEWDNNWRLIDPSNLTMVPISVKKNLKAHFCKNHEGVIEYIFFAIESKIVSHNYHINDRPMASRYMAKKIHLNVEIHDYDVLVN